MGEPVFPREEYTNGYPTLNWSVLKTYTHKKHYMDRAGCIYAFRNTHIHIYVTITKGIGAMNLCV